MRSSGRESPDPGLEDVRSSRNLLEASRGLLPRRFVRGLREALEGTRLVGGLREACERLGRSLRELSDFRSSRQVLCSFWKSCQRLVRG